MLKQFVFLCSIIFLISCNNTKVENKSNEVSATNPKDDKWWKEAIVYQIYPRSFKDSDGDGVGDLKGIISKLDYIKSLGIDIVWLNPIYGSPNADNGYDISDYQSIMKEFGTMNDFNTLLNCFHDRGIKCVLDLVVNHSSDEHKWFMESKKSRNNPYRNYYHWWPAERGKPAFRPGSFEADGSGWRYDSTTHAYYLHYFSYKQPDLNWENPVLRKEIYTMMDWWFKKGIDGFRMDVISIIGKDTSFPQISQKEIEQKYGDWFTYFASTPTTHTYLQEMNKEVLSKYNVMALAEGSGTTKATALNFVDPDRKELDMAYHFDGVNLGYEKGKYKTMNPNWSLVDFKKIYSDWDSVFANKGWGTIYLANHDQPRMVSRWGNDAPEYREASSKMLTTFLLSMRGTPYYYYGDEIGMTNLRLNKKEDFRDIEIMAEFGKIENAKGNVQAFIDEQVKYGGGRDNGRSPMQWDASTNAGFTTGVPWLKINDNKAGINVEADEKNANSTLNYFRKMAKLRKEHKEVLVYGKYTLLDANNPCVYAYTREAANGEKVLVLLSFRKDGGTFELGKIQLGNEWINNLQPLQIESGKVKLKPYQACIVQLK